jgi:hypothetical protein
MLNRLRIFGAVAMLALVSVLHNTETRAQATQVPPGEVCFQATTGLNGFIGTLGAITGGSGGAAGTYANVPFTGGSGTGGTANITVSGGTVTAAQVVSPGLNYAVGDILSAAGANIGGVAGFQVLVASNSINSSLAGGKVGMYVPGTLTPSQTWVNASETTLNSNPIALDSNGCAVIFGVGTYRQILYDSLGNEVWDRLTSVTPVNPYWAGTAGGTANAITVTDTGFAQTDGQSIQFLAAYPNTRAATLSVNGGTPIPILENSPSGPIALIGGEISATGNFTSVVYSSSLNSFILTSYQNTATLINVNVPFPQGRLTLVATSGGLNTPVMTSTVTAAGTIYYTPYQGGVVPLWNGSGFIPTFCPEISNILANSSVGNAGPAVAVASSIYDLFVWNNAGTCTLTRGPAWTNFTTRSLGGSRVNGILVNGSSITNGPLYGYGTYVGTVATDSSGATVTWNIGGSASGGSAGFLDVWNMYNRVIVSACSVDTGAIYSYNIYTIRQARASTGGNQINFVTGIAEDSIQASISASFQTNYQQDMGIGLDSTSTFYSQQISPAGNASQPIAERGDFVIAPILGSHYISRNERGNNANSTYAQDIYSLDNLCAYIRM